MHACVVGNRGPLLARSLHRALPLPSSLKYSLRRHPPSSPQRQQNRLTTLDHRFSEEWKLFAGEDDTGSPPDAAGSITEKQAQPENMRDTVLASGADVEAAGGDEFGLDKQDALDKQPEQLAAPGLLPFAPVRQAAVVSSTKRLAQVDIDLKMVQDEIEEVTGEWRTALGAWKTADLTRKPDALVELQLLESQLNRLASNKKELLALQASLAPLAAAEAEAEASAAGAEIAGSATSQISVEEYAANALRTMGRLTAISPHMYELVGEEHMRLPDSGISAFFVDPDHATVESIQLWLARVKATWAPPKNQPLPDPLVINGMIKTGKSHVLTRIVPALLAADEFFGIDSKAPVLLCSLNLSFAPMTTEGQDRRRSYLSALQALYAALRSWAAAVHVPVEMPSWAANLNIVADLQQVILDFVRGIDYPVMYLIDEVQAWYLVDDPESARQFFKYLVAYGPRKAAFAVTGSSMCTFWFNLVRTTTWGTALVLASYKLHLPAVVHNSIRRATWAYLKTRQPDLPDAMYSFMVQQPAMMVYVCRAYLNLGIRPQGVTELRDFVANIEEFKIFAEMYADFYEVLCNLDNEERTQLRELASAAGVDMTGMDDGVYEYLQPYTVGPKEKARLISPYHRRLIKLLVQDSGALLPLSKTFRAEWVPLSYSEEFTAFSNFGEALKSNVLKGKTLQGVWPSSHKPLQLYLKGLCAEHPAMQAKNWHQQRWLQYVLHHPANNVKHDERSPTAADAFNTDLEKGRPKWLLLRRYFTMSKNICSHQGIGTAIVQLVADYPFTARTEIASSLEDVLQQSRVAASQPGNTPLLQATAAPSPRSRGALQTPQQRRGVLQAPKKPRGWVPPAAASMMGYRS